MRFLHIINEITSLFLDIFLRHTAADLMRFYGRLMGGVREVKISCHLMLKSKIWAFHVWKLSISN